jgi:hypothetical protein
MKSLGAEYQISIRASGMDSESDGEFQMPGTGLIVRLSASASRGRIPSPEDRASLLSPRPSLPSVHAVPGRYQIPGQKQDGPQDQEARQGQTRLLEGPDEGPRRRRSQKRPDPAQDGQVPEETRPNDEAWVRQLFPVHEARKHSLGHAQDQERDETQEEGVPYRVPPVGDPSAQPAQSDPDGIQDDRRRQPGVSRV